MSSFSHHFTKIVKDYRSSFFIYEIYNVETNTGTTSTTTTSTTSTTTSTRARNNSETVNYHKILYISIGVVILLIFLIIALLIYYCKFRGSKNTTETTIITENPSYGDFADFGEYYEEENKNEIYDRNEYYEENN